MKLSKIKLLCGLAASCLLALASCTKQLDIKPTGIVLAEEALKTDQDVVRLINSAYTVLASDRFYGGRIGVVSEILADKVVGSTLNGADLNTYNHVMQNTFDVENFYSEAYIAVFRANVTLNNLALVKDEAVRKNIEGQAKFIRAISHFELVRLFAQPYGATSNNTHLGIVLKTNTELETGRTRNTVGEVYSQVLSDLKSADTLLPENNNLLPSKYAAKAMLARVYFQMNDFANAFAYSDEVIKSNKFAFDNSPAYVTKRFSQAGTPEAIFKLVNENGSDNRFVTLRNTFDSSGYLRLTRVAYQAGTNPADVRRAWYEDSVINDATVYFSKKYKATQIQLPVVHLTEMLLTRAESAAELNKLEEAKADLNLILNRAYSGTQTFTGNDKGQLIRRIREQRELEMILEGGDRLQQIKRIGARGEPSTSRGAAWNCVGMILQIPYTERNTDPNFVFNPTGSCN